MDRWQSWTDHDASRHIAVPTEHDDKYSRGVLGIIAGSKQYPGAAVLACEAAMQTGVGMVRYFGPRDARKLVLQYRPEVVTRSGKVQAWVIGPGIESRKIDWQRREKITEALESKAPIILDAGGISLLNRAKGPTLITPHYGELSALLLSRGITVSRADIEREPRNWAVRTVEEFGVTILLKGNLSIVASENSRIELPASTPWLATAGTGDVLAGIIGALVATHADVLVKQPELLAEIAATASLLHTLAARSASAGGPITALKVADAIPQAVLGLISK